MRTDLGPAFRHLVAHVQDARGVLLIETIVALGLFALGVATMGGFMVHQIRAAGSNRYYTEAYTLAEQELEDLRALEYQDIAPRSSESAVGGMTYKIESKVKSGDPGPNMKGIKVTVTWNEPGGKKNVELRTIYTAIKR